MKRAVIALTEGGLKIAKKIKSNMDCDIYTLKKHIGKNDYMEINGSLKEFMGYAFYNFSEIIMIMSCGIAVRTLAPYIESKLTDPAVIVLDELGNSVISLISGHIGGANELSKKVAKITEGNAIITTASDTIGVESVDMFAKRNGLLVSDFEDAKRVTADIVNGESVGLISEINDTLKLHDGIRPATFQSIRDNEFKSFIYVGKKDDLKCDTFYVKLYKKSLALGIGCKKDTPYEKLYSALCTLLNCENINRDCIGQVATIELKKDENAIGRLCETLDVPLIIYSIADIKSIEDGFIQSDFVREITGVGAVCEPCAYLASNKGRCIVKKTSFDGITLSIYEKSEVFDIG